VLEAQNTKGGISRTAPRQPKPPVHSLPPILSEVSRTPISSCSKGSRGLSVLPQVLGIFTETLISPSPSLRQRPSRYAIRAGRNFTDPTVSDGGRLSLHLTGALRSFPPISLHDRQLHRLPFLVRAGVLPTADAASLSFRISRYGVTKTSLGITIWQSQEGFPDMSRYSAAPHGAAGQVVLTRQGISLP
jgi:hypothetical protein